MDADLDTLATALYVKIEDLLKALAAMAIISPFEARWLQHAAGARLHKRLRACVHLVRRVAMAHRVPATASRVTSAAAGAAQRYSRSAEVGQATSNDWVAVSNPGRQVIVRRVHVKAALAPVVTSRLRPSG